MKKYIVLGGVNGAGKSTLYQILDNCSCLLRKVFGRKQIDDLLEQARTVKGRKRDNTRSR